jgi:hypothetical protein
MSTDSSSFNLTVEEFMKYAPYNKDMPACLKHFAANMNYQNRKVKPINSTKWKNSEEEESKNWLLKKDINKSKEDVFYSTIRGILNKLSEATYDELFANFVSNQVTTSEQMLTIVELIFEKAVVEQKFSKLYSRLCSDLVSRYSIIKKVPKQQELEEWDQEEDEEEDDEEQDGVFRELLITKCQTTFEEGISLGETDTQSEFGTKLFKYKENLFGFIIFIGELYNHTLLSDNIINSCFMTLVDKFNEKKSYAMEGLCSLMKTIGTQFFKNSPELAEACFNKLEEFKNSNDIGIRDKFSVMDLIDIRHKYEW